MEITFYGHACFALVINGCKLLIDPFIRPNELAKDIDIEAIEADYILISHGHEDHVADALYLAQKNNATIVSNFEIVSWFASQGHDNGHPMNIGGQKDFGDFQLKSVNALHSSVLPDGTYGGNPGGFIIRSKNKNVYYAGDTALHLDMKLIGDYENIDAAFLPIGDNFTMGIEDACIASEFINCSNIIGMHFDTFPYIEIDHAFALEHFETNGRSLKLLEIGENWKL